VATPIVKIHPEEGETDQEKSTELRRFLTITRQAVPRDWCSTEWDFQIYEISRPWQRLFVVGQHRQIWDPVGFFFLKLLEKKGVDGMNEDRVPKTQPLGEKACLQCTGKAQELCLDLHIFSPHYVNPTEQWEWWKSGLNEGKLTAWMSRQDCMQNPYCLNYAWLNLDNGQHNTVGHTVQHLSVTKLMHVY